MVQSDLKQAKSAESSPSEKTGFGRFAPLATGIAKRAGKTAAYAAIVSSIAIGGANLGTYFDYTYNNYDYKKLENKTRIELDGAASQEPLVQKAIEASRIKIVGSKPPEEARLVLNLSKDEKGTTFLEADYTMVWSTNKGVAHRDEEEVKMSWSYSESQNRFVPEKASTRYHFKWVEMPLGGINEPVIVIQNPAHTPGIPGASLRYTDSAPGLVDIFTVFSAEKWAGSCLSTGLPQKFNSMDVRFKTEQKL